MAYKDSRDPRKLESQRRYREKNRDVLCEKAREYQCRRRAEDPGYAERGRERIRRLVVEQPEHLAEIRRRSYEKHAERRRSERRDYTLEAYGINREQLGAMYAAQDGCCAICREPVPMRGGPSAMHIDHDHKTGLVRGLLCINCNHGLGKFRDDIARLEAAIVYLSDRR